MNLFWKIFVWFWSAMLVLGAALFGIATATRPDPLPTAWRQAMTQTLAVYAAQNVEAYEKGGAPALNSALQRWRGPARFGLYDGAARQLSHEFARDTQNSRSPTDEMERFDEHGRHDGAGPGRGPLPDHVRERLSALVQKTLHENTARTQFDLNGRTVLVAQFVRGASGRVYVLAGEIARPLGGRAPIQSRTLWLGLGALLVLSTLLCYGLARTVTAPITALRAATQRLAQGDLGARVGANEGAKSARRDELAELNRDFDTMAARIETLMNAQQNLVEAQRRLLGDVSHELRSPLTRLSVALAVARHHESAPEIHHAHERIGLEIVRLNDLIGQLLQLARLENLEHATQNSAAKDSEMARVDLAILVRDVVADAQFEASERNRSVTATLTPCKVRGNGALLHSAIENVVRNAIRHTPENSSVEVTLNCENAVAILSVRDWGAGVPEASLSELFQPFYRVEAARDRESGGAGLGLSITQRAARWHGGSVRAENVAPHGLRVEIRLPVLDELPDQKIALF